MSLQEKAAYAVEFGEPHTNRSALQCKLIEFHRAMKAPVLPTPQVPADDRVRLRAKLNLEEAVKEFFEACFDLTPGTYYGDEFEQAVLRLGLVAKFAPVKVDLPATADALADAAYVVEGANLEFGIDSGPVLDEVHRANMAKVGGPVRADGKIGKPEGWQPPDIIGVLTEQQK